MRPKAQMDSGGRTMFEVVAILGILVALWIISGVKTQGHH